MKALFTIAAISEFLVGLALVALPRLVIGLLLGVEPHGDGMMIGRVAGVALLCLGIACWWARADPGSPARAGTINAIILYNAGAGVLLLVFAATGAAAGFVVWIVGMLHVGLAAAFTLTRGRKDSA
jgi:hypothetical protein